MIEWYGGLYMDGEVSKSPEAYKKAAEDGRLDITPVYCISIASNEENLLDIISSNELFFRHYKRSRIYVIGLAATYQSAVALAADILLEVYGKTDGFDIRSYCKAPGRTGV